MPNSTTTNASPASRHSLMRGRSPPPPPGLNRRRLRASLEEGLNPRPDFIRYLVTPGPMTPCPAVPAGALTVASIPPSLASMLRGTSISARIPRAAESAQSRPANNSTASASERRPRSAAPASRTDAMPRRHATSHISGMRGKSRRPAHGPGPDKGGRPRRADGGAVPRRRRPPAHCGGQGTAVPQRRRRRRCWYPPRPLPVAMRRRATANIYASLAV